MNYIKGFFYTKLKNFTLNITFKFRTNGITLISGESGAGKTTLLRCITGLIRPKYGYLCINKKIMQNSKKNFFINTNKRNIGLIFQNPYLFPHMSVYQNIKLGYSKNSIKISDVINSLNLKNFLNRNVSTLSGGETQKISMAQVILTNPKILLLDEPFTSQDYKTKNSVIKYLKNIHKNFSIPIICSSHNIKEIYHLGNRLIYINKGKIKYVES